MAPAGAKGVPMFRGLGPVAILAVALSLPTCHPSPGDKSGSAEQPTFTAHDSAGIEIVENHAPQHPAGSFWTIDPEPEFVLGGTGNVTGAAHDSSQLIWRVVGLARLQDGRVAVLSSGNKQLMLFEPSGELSRIIGGPGEGPGEFIHPLALQYLPPDTLVVWDQFLSSIDHFDSDGTLLRERSIDPARMSQHGGWTESLRIPLPDGSLLLGLLDRTADESPDDCTHLTVLGRTSLTVRGHSSPEYDVMVHGEELLRIDDAYAAHSFGCARVYRTHLAAGGDPPFVYISNDDNEIHQRSLDGTLVRIIRRTTEPPPVTDKAWRAESEHRARNRETSGRPPQTEEDEPIRRREKYPAVETVVVDAEGHLWVREWSASESGIPDQWSVFSPRGRWLGVLPFPPDPAAPDLQICGQYSTPCRAGKDYFLIVRQDELGRERVEGYRIRRNGQ